MCGERNQRERLTGAHRTRVQKFRSTSPKRRELPTLDNLGRSPWTSLYLVPLPGIPVRSCMSLERHTSSLDYQRTCNLASATRVMSYRFAFHCMEWNGMELFANRGISNRSKYIMMCCLSMNMTVQLILHVSLRCESPIFALPWIGRRPAKAVLKLCQVRAREL